MVATAWHAAQLWMARLSLLGDLSFSDGVVDGPEPEDVKAGWTAFALFLLLALAVAVLARSLVKQLRKAQRAADAGVYDDRDTARGGPGTGGHEGPGTSGDDRPEGRSGSGPDTRDGDHPA